MERNQHSSRGTRSSSDNGPEKIARDIEADIVFGVLKPGQKLPEEELAVRFSATRHHVREALVRLERIGIVTKERNKGVSVRHFSLDDVRQIYEVRENLQRLAALMIRLPAPKPSIRALVAIHDNYEDAVDRGDLQAIHELNDRFHTDLFRLCGNDVLSQLVKHFMDITYAIRANAFSDPEHLASARREHRIMIDLLSTRDSWALAQICVDHIQHSKEQYIAMLADQEALPAAPTNGKVTRRRRKGRQ
ncbi:MAG: GntR family transcriptional regulator [Rhodospirillales bacterium]|nr:GntR family transcriptional regulator [Rhodospirillales bacterium]